MIGTPQVRCREMHQSGRPEIMLWMRSRPQDGTHSTSFSMAARARWRRAFFSMDTNHWVVARKMTGFLQRQQWG
jgi:hypothetical protein